MTHRKEKIFQGILHNLYHHFFGLSGLLMLANYIRSKSEATITLTIIPRIELIETKKVTIDEKDSPTIEDYIVWTKEECQKRKVPFSAITEITFSMEKKKSKFLFFIPQHTYTNTTQIKTKDKTFVKTFPPAVGWLF